MHAMLRGAQGTAARAMLLLLFVCATLATPAAAQRPVQPNDTVRTLTTGGLFAGPILAVDSTHLLLGTRWHLRPLDLELRPGDVKCLEVYAGKRSRLGGALIGAAAGGLLAGSLVAAVHAQGVTMKEMGLTRLAVGFTVAMTVSGFVFPGQLWQASGLARRPSLPNCVLAPGTAPAGSPSPAQP